MRWLPLLGATVAALTFAGPAAPATVTVGITAKGFVAKSVTIRPGDTVEWMNLDASSHQVVADASDFASPVLSAGQSYVFTFDTIGNFRYHDGLDSRHKGTVIVTAAPAGESVTLDASSASVTFGGTVDLSGSVSNEQHGERVTVLARRFGDQSFTPIGTVTTKTGGSWTLAVGPAIQTTYAARWQSATSAAVAVGVRPRISFRALSGRRFAAKVAAGGSFAGSFVYVQRRAAGRWVSIDKVLLDSRSSVIFRPPLPTGTSTLRILITADQVGPGYLTGASDTIVYRRG